MGLFNRRKRQQQASENARRVNEIAAARQESAARNKAARESDAPAADSGPELDTFFGDEPLRAASAALQAGSWGDAEALMASRPGDHRSLRALGDEDTSLETLAHWHTEIGSPTTASVLGNAFQAHAWKIRGTGYADTVNDWGSVDELMVRSAEMFVKAIELDPAFVPAHLGRLTSGMAGSADAAEIRSLFDSVHALSPFHPAAVWTMVQALAPKWGGDVESMFEFARWVDQNAPLDNPSRVAIVDAHFENAMVKAHNGEGNLLVLMLSKEITGELDDAFERLLSQLDDQAPAPIEFVNALNGFLFYAGDNDERQTHMQQKGWRVLGDRPTEQPWRILARKGNVVTTFQNQRQRRLDMINAKDEFMATAMAEIKAKMAADGLLPKT